MKFEEMKSCAPRALKLLKTMANENRLFILCTLLEGEISVNDLAERINLSQSALSQHLAKLRQDEFVTTRKESQTVYYSLLGDDTKQMLQLLHQMYAS
jgi:DNA-binding transcriptional ArsR family regulator